MFSSVHPWNDTRVFYKEAVSLARKGFNVKLCAVGNGVKYDGSVDNLIVENLPKVKRVVRPIIWTRLFIKAFRENADVYHFHDPELLVVGFLLKKFTRSKVIYDMHEDFPAAIKSKAWIPGRIRNSLSNIVAYLEKFFIRRCDAVIYAEKYYKKNYKDINILKEDILNYPLENSILIKSSNENVPNIIYAGAISKNRGLFEMLKVANELKKRNVFFKMTLIGEFSDSLMEETITFVKSNNLYEVVELPGRLPLQKVCEYYGKSTIGLAILHPEKNYLQSLPTKIFEYMSFGMPFVASNFPDWKELIEKNKCGIVVDPFNIEQITDALHEILNKKELCIKFGENGYKAYCEQFNWIIEERKLIKLYEKF